MPAPSVDVQFQNTSSGAIASYLWDFDDGSPLSSIENPLHTYSLPADYNVNLKIQGIFGGNNQITKPVHVPPNNLVWDTVYDEI